MGVTTMTGNSKHHSHETEHWYEVLCGQMYVVTRTASGRLVYTKDTDFDLAGYFLRRRS